jgi:hypothetical protein
MMVKRRTARRCNAKTADGKVCNSSALLGSVFCFFHDPTKSAERREAQALGGRQNRTRVLGLTEPQVTLRDCGDVVALVSETINQVRMGVIDPRVANSVGYLANVLIKAFERDELETRIEKLEALFERRREASERTMPGS